METLTLTPAEVENLRRLVSELFSLMAADEDGVLLDVYDSVAVAAEILGLGPELESFEDNL